MEVERSRAKKSYLSRSRSRMFKQPNISKAVYGKENVVKLTTTVQALTGAGDGIWRTVYPLVQTLQASNDWANFAGSYQNFNIIKVKIQVIPGVSSPTSTAFTNTQFMGIAYSGKDATAVTNINQLPDYQNFMVWSPVNADAFSRRFFKFKPRPKIRPPQQTGDAAENFGWLKSFSTNIGNSLSKDCCYLVFTFSCIFSGEA